MTARTPAARPSPLPAFLLGWGVGALLFLVVRTVGLALLEGPCTGRTTLALLMPLVLGPGGLALTATNWGRPRRVALGLGLVVASFLPALAGGVRDLGVLRATGCAGGYVVVAPAGQGSVAEVTLRPGETLNLTARVGGYTPQTHPGPFALSAASTNPNVVPTLPGRRQAPAGEAVPLALRVTPDAPRNSYTVTVQGTQRRDGQTFTAVGTLTVNVSR
ncbi:hypothetical protein V3W47_13700 [Deinococcus sp. YIM 134068]|uniref:hypothetical protein n=1 Tax=Deinococcus lichenicola TaxID=3118910 RepID=UPI002F94B88C